MKRKVAVLIFLLLMFALAITLPFEPILFSGMAIVAIIIGIWSVRALLIKATPFTKDVSKEQDHNNGDDDYY